LKYLLIISTLLIFASCGKKTQIKITAKNAATGQGYEGLGFRLKEVKPYTTSTGEVQKTVFEGTFNAQGEAVFEYRLKNRSYIITTLVPEEELCYINDTQYFLHRDDDNLKFDFRFAPCAYRTLKIENINCEGLNDLFELDMRLLYDEDNTVFFFPEKQGCYSNEFTNEKVPAGKWVVEWWVTRSGNTNYFTDTIELIENELFYYEINY
jgi:hypothetical protein